jgi:hypothetical protein
MLPDGKITVRLQGSNSSNFSFNTTTTHNNIQWHHVALTFDGFRSDINLYIDGRLDTQKRLSTSNLWIYGLSNNTTIRLILGSDEAGVFGGQTDRQFRGSLAEVRVWTLVRSAGQISNMYGRTLVGNETGLVMYNRLDQGIANGSNSGITTVVNNMITGGSVGELGGRFALSDSVSNWTSGPPLFNPLRVVNASNDSEITFGVIVSPETSTSVKLSLQLTGRDVPLTSIKLVVLGNQNGRESAASATQPLIGHVKLYREPNFRGESLNLLPGQYQDNWLADMRFNDLIQSIRVPSGLAVTVYEHNFWGESARYTSDVASGLLWSISSVEVVRV